MTDIENIQMIAETTAKFMDTLEGVLEEVGSPKIKHVCVVADVEYLDSDGDRQSHVILETDSDDRIVQIGITTAAASAATFGDPMGAEDEL